MLTSVRLRLLILALAPMIILAPGLLFLGMQRFNDDYDKVLIANVESDLRIAEQHLAQILRSTGDDLTAVAVSAAFATLLDLPDVARAGFMDDRREALNLDFLYYIPAQNALDLAAAWPVIQDALSGQARVAIDVFGHADLQQISPSLANRATIPLIPTEAAVPTDRTAEDRGMVVHAAAPVRSGPHEGVLVGGILLNRNLKFIDEINALVYLNAITGGNRQGTATLFLDDVRISTNVRLFEDVRALGTRVSAAVRGAVLGDGATWLKRAFVVNDWYISGYLPLSDSFGTRVGMLYVGFLEAPFATSKRNALLWMIGAFIAVLAVSVPAVLWLAKGIFAPLERIQRVIARVQGGDLSARIRHKGARDEIGQVADLLDNLLVQLQERDARLRGWAQELNTRVEDRTAELRAANEQLETTYRQLVLNEKLAAIGEITAGVAHEINNPVAVIQGNLDLMRDILAEAGDAVRVEMDLIDRQVGRIQTIVGKLLTFARPRDYSSARPLMDLSTLTEDCVALVRHQFSRKDIDIITDYQPAPQVKINPDEIQQIIINLLVNAMQAIDTKGQIQITITPAQGGIQLSIHDSGPGLDPDVETDLFKPFFTTKIGSGTGLGLSISQTLADRAGGHITAQNAPTGGAIFSLWLPAAQ